MKSRRFLRASGMAMLFLLAIPGLLAAQDNQESNDHRDKHRHYQLVDMGTFSGPTSFVSEPSIMGSPLSESGVMVGGSATPEQPPISSNPLACGGLSYGVSFVNHAFRWQNGAVTDLGVIPGGSCSKAFAVNRSGEIVGISENGLLDSITYYEHDTRAVRWKNGEIQDLGSFGGNQNAANGINKRGQVVGFSLNTTPDQFSIIDGNLGAYDGTQTRAFLWQDGRMQDLGTLGNDAGPDAIALFINERGQVAGYSYTSSNPVHGLGVPPADPFLWEHGKGMIDLGTLGGAYGLPTGINNRGQVIGRSGIAAEQGACYPNTKNCHPFLWDDGKLIDLQTHTKGAKPLSANAINDAGEIVGAAAFPNAPSDAYLWKNGVARDLGVLNQDCSSEAKAINSRRQVIAVSVSCDGSNWRAFLWEEGSAVDLNTLIPADSSLELAYPLAINERGEIGGIGVPRGVSPANFATLGHAFLLIPCGEDGGNEGCEGSEGEAP
jgi:probable HAF family extracellular repeat protein